MQAKIQFTVVNDDGTPFFYSELKYDGMDYANVVELEAAAAQFAVQLVEMGKAKAAARATA
jgi:hypothetical protein